MLEDFLNKAVKRKIYSLILGIIYVFISYGTAQLFFPNDISTAMIILITLLFVPTTSKLLAIEEKIERRDGTRYFLKDHKTLIEIFLFLFIGISIGYLLVGNYFPTSLTYQTDILEKQGALTVSDNIQKTQQLIGISINNIEVIVIAFVLSLFYGAGALFLIVRTASVFAAYILKFSQTISQTATFSALIFSLHFIPELFGFLLAAMAGGVISKALTKEKIGTTPFRNVVKDSTILLILSILLIVIAAILEVYVTSGLVKSLI